MMLSFVLSNHNYMPVLFLFIVSFLFYREFQKRSFQELLIPVTAFSCDEDPLSSLYLSKEVLKETTSNSNDNRRSRRFCSFVCILLKNYDLGCNVSRKQP